MALAPESRRGPVKLSRTRRAIVYLAGAGLWVTGAAWLVLHYFCVRKTDFGPQPHPLEYWSRAAHGLFGFFSLWVLGLLWAAHIVGGWQSTRRRITGLATAAVLGALIVSGYLLYYVGDDRLLAWTSLIHWAIGLSLPVVFLAHRIRMTARG
ncbi:MAG TPA: hypothetical protein VGU69_05690 [Rhizomicrobium sp.]|nr:hypothetical protein [Rhizomicrobium sp.]